MKKVFVLVCMALSMSAMAQRLTPLTVEVFDPKLDSIRAVCAADPQLFVATLNSIQRAMDENAKELKEARNVLKQEQSHAKEKDSYLKDISNTAATLKKLYSKEEEELRSMQKNIEKQQRTLSKLPDLNRETREMYQHMLEKEQKDLGYSIREVAERQRATSDMETEFQNEKTRLQNYMINLEQKASALDQLEALWRTRNDQLKAEIKYAKSLKK
ncbi:MAG: hypothetical protein K6A36_01285 [Paludibacteraceae bacterium]|nr:hypothetical protein [Paludibacteraceae bacterium]